MAGMTPILTKGFKAEAAIVRRRICKFGAADTSVLHAAAATDFSFGISTEIDSALGEPVDLVLIGATEVEYGGAVTRGQKLTSDAVGRAIAAAPGAGVNAQIIGVAQVSGVLGDIGTALLSHSVMQG
jgi:Uncharacterized conserved protein (DUF2190)